MSPDQIKDLANSIISSAAPQPPVEGLREAAPPDYSRRLRAALSSWEAAQ